MASAEPHVGDASGAEARSCPVCGSLRHQILYRQSFATFSRGSIGDGYDVVACNDCGMCFASGLPDGRRFAQYYADSSKYDLAAGEARLSPEDERRYADQADFVAASIPERDLPVLDVGTATGGFLKALRDRGFSRLSGVEPAPEAALFARDVLGLDVRVGGLESAMTWGHPFGLLSYVAVLEHLLDPRAQMQAVGTILDPGGYVFVSVPDAESFAQHARAPFQQFSVEHINYFTGPSLANVMGSAGYRLVAQRRILMRLGSDGEDPALEAIYQWDGVIRPVAPDPSGSDFIRAYVLECEQVEAGIAERLGRLAASGDPIYVWGTGTHTLHLLETTPLKDCRIEGFIDSNPHYAGGTLLGRPVLAPSQLSTVDAPILVGSIVSRSSIAAAARTRFGPNVPLILLDEAVDAPG